MKLNKAVIMALSQGKGMTQNELARCIDINRGSLSNALSGRRGAGRKLLSGLLKVFTEESVASLTVNERRLAS